MREFYRNYLENNRFFIFFSIAALILIVAGFIAPPIGQIDSSVLIAVGELNGTLAIGAVIKSIDKGRSASIKYNGTELDITSNENKEEGE